MATKTIDLAALATQWVDPVATERLAMQEAEEKLAALEEEQRAIGTKMMNASMAGDATTFFALKQRQTELVSEIHFTRSTVKRLDSAMCEAFAAFAAAAVPELERQIKEIRAELAPLEAKANTRGYLATKIREMARSYRQRKASADIAAENLQIEFQHQTAMDNAPVIRNLIGFYRGVGA